MARQSDQLAREARAMRRIEMAMGEIPATTRQRVLRWAVDTYGLPGQLYQVTPDEATEQEG